MRWDGRNRFRMSLSNGAAGGARRCFVAGNDFSNGWLTTQVDVLCRGELEVDRPGTWHTDRAPGFSRARGLFSFFAPPQIGEIPASPTQRANTPTMTIRVSTAAVP